MRNFQDPNYKKWRKEVYKRDHHKCQWPNCSISKSLNAHHIRTWAHYPGLRFDVNNGITLCSQHHKMIKGLESIYESVFSKMILDKQNDK